MKAKIKYENGYLIELPSNGNAPMLFLEWISEFPSGKNPIQKIIDGNGFKIRLNQTKVGIEKCVKYINDNL